MAPAYLSASWRIQLHTLSYSTFLQFLWCEDIMEAGEIWEVATLTRVEPYSCKANNLGNILVGLQEDKRAARNNWLKA